MADHCSQQVSSGPRSMRYHQCHRRAVLTENNEGWCKQHAPSSVTARRKANKDRWKAERAVKEARWDREALAETILEHAEACDNEHCKSLLTT